MGRRHSSHKRPLKLQPPALIALWPHALFQGFQILWERPQGVALG